MTAKQEEEQAKPAGDTSPADPGQPPVPNPQPAPLTYHFQPWFFLD